MKIPSLSEACHLLEGMFIYGILALLIGFRFKFLEFGVEGNWSVIIKVIITTLFAPAILEEFFFRVLLLPHPSENSSISFLSIWIIISLFLFLIYHPLNGLTLFIAGQKTFTDPRFLILAAGLGIFCTFIYLDSGSLWSPVVFHWIVVVSWLLCFGGKAKLMQLPKS